ncbi:MAG: type III pantothenate kinase [Bacteroidales bacterium]|nr:type III pantothenate kinase [Bacteroidales bacterium]
MNLIIDIGNTSCKAAIYDGMVPKTFFRIENPLDIFGQLGNDEKFDKVVLSSVRNYDEKLNEGLKKLAGSFIDFNLDYVREQLANGNTLFNSLDNMPDGMGADRMAAIYEASRLYPQGKLMVFDFGTATTVEFIDNSHYEGGSISLGLATRYRALAHFTQKIPLLRPMDFMKNHTLGDISTVGYDLDTALASGNILGIKFEIEGYMAANPDRKVILTGGDAVFYAGHLSKEVRHEQHLVLNGLAHIAMNNE